MGCPFDELPDGGKDIIAKTESFFGDLFDREEGTYGPFLGEFTNFGRKRLVDLLDEAIGLVVIMAAPIPGVADYSPKSYPYNRPLFRYCLMYAHIVCVIRHLMRSYVEIPDTGRVGAPDVVRRDYLTRWQSLLKDYEDLLGKAAKRLSEDIYDEEYAAGHYQKTLVDWPSMGGGYVPFSRAERMQYLTWW